MFQDCFSISILHLLAQTDITKSFKPNPLKTCVWDKCPLPACILSNFLYEYLAPKKVPIDVSFLTKNYKAFGIYNPHDIDCGDFLRSVLNVVAKNETHLTNNIKEMCFTHLEWKFECSKCLRFMTMAIKDYVIKIKVNQEKSLGKLLEDFIYHKTCPCGQQFKMKPTAKHLGKYLFLEIDRTVYLSMYIFIRLLDKYNSNLPCNNIQKFKTKHKLCTQIFCVMKFGYGFFFYFTQA